MISRPTFHYEDQHANDIVCGIDEVGRGPLAGPVVAAAVVLKRDKLPLDLIAAINDSKKLNAKKRAYLYDRLPEFSHVAIAQCSVAEIDEINILQSSLLAMKKAFDALEIKPRVALVDGNKAPKLGCATQTIVGGDAKSLSIAAASIMAKHYRDMLMGHHTIEFPHYGWEKNAGYGTAQHLKAIEIHGVTPLHRRSFAPIAKHLHKESSTNN